MFFFKSILRDVKLTERRRDQGYFYVQISSIKYCLEFFLISLVIFGFVLARFQDIY